MRKADHDRMGGGTGSVACQSCDNDIPEVVRISEGAKTPRSRASDMEDQSGTAPDQISSDPRQKEKSQNDPAARNSCPQRPHRFALIGEPASLDVFSLILRQCHISSVEGHRSYGWQR